MKQLLIERFQQLAGIKPLYEYQVESHYAWRSTEEEAESQKNTLHHERLGEYVSATKPDSLQAYEGNDKSLNPDEFSHIGEWPKNAKKFGEGEAALDKGKQWVERANKRTQDLYTKFEEGGELADNEYASPEEYNLETDKEGNIVKYVFSIRTLRHNRTME